MKRDMIFPLILLVAACTLYYIGFARDTSAESTIGVLLLWWAEAERKKAAEKRPKIDNQ